MDIARCESNARRDESANGRSDAVNGSLLRRLIIPTRRFYRKTGGLRPAIFSETQWGSAAMLEPPSPHAIEVPGFRSTDTHHSTKIPRRLLLHIAAAWVVPATLDALQRYIRELLDSQPGVAWNLVVFQGAQWLFLAALTPITFYIAERYIVRRTNWGRPLAAHLAGALALCIGWSTLCVLLARQLDLPGTEVDLATAFTKRLLNTASWSLVTYFAMLGFVQAYVYFAEARERDIQALRLAGQLAEARLDALRRQLNPHFLFNSLNAITVLVRERKTRAASRVLELLSDLLRQVLPTEQPHEVPLRQELEFVERYLAIEKVRFSDRLHVEFEVENAVRAALVPTFILQPLVENAVKHGVARRANAGKILVAARLESGALCLSVQDDGIGFDALSRVPGVGLSNTQERLRTLYGDRAILTIDALPIRGTRVSIVMPCRSLDA